MELPENVRIEWQTITELNNDDLIKFLKEVYQSIRIGSPVAAQMVSLDAVKQMMIIADSDNEEISVSFKMINKSGNTYQKILAIDNWFSAIR